MNVGLLLHIGWSLFFLLSYRYPSYNVLQSIFLSTMLIQIRNVYIAVFTSLCTSIWVSLLWSFFLFSTLLYSYLVITERFVCLLLFIFLLLDWASLGWAVCFIQFFSINRLSQTLVLSVSDFGYFFKCMLLLAFCVLCSLFLLFLNFGFHIAKERW